MAPAAMPSAAWVSRSSKDDDNENSPVPIATVNTPNVTIAPVASLKADSHITVCATRSRTWTWRKIGTKVAGSVEASVAPSSAATIQGTPRTKCAAVLVMIAVINTPTVAMTMIVIQTCFIT